MIPQERRQPIAAKWVRKTANKRETTKKIGMDPQEQVAQNQKSSFSDNLKAPPKTSKIKQLNGTLKNGVGT